MPWIFFSLLSILAVSISNILQRVLMKDDKSDPFLYSIVFQFAAAAITGTFALIKGFALPPIGQLPLNFFLEAVLYGLGTVFIFKSLQGLESSEVTILSSARLLVTIITAVFLLHEPFGLMRILGACLIIFAILLVTERKKGFKLNRGILYAFLMSLCYGLAVTNDAFILRQNKDVLSYTAIAFFLPGIFLLFIKPDAIKKMPSLLRPSAFRNMLIMSFFYSVAAVSFYTAIGLGGNASQVGPINQASVIVTVILAILFLGEKKNLIKKIVSAIIVFAGVLALR